MPRLIVNKLTKQPVVAVSKQILIMHGDAAT